MQRLLLFLVFVAGVAATRVLMGGVETELLALSGAVVPDVGAVMGSAEEFRALFDRFTYETRAIYLQALWTLDVAFPLALAGACSTVGTDRLTRWLPFLAAAIDIALENTIATMVLLGNHAPALLTAYAVVNTAKFVCIAVSIAAAGEARILSRIKRATP